MAFPVMPPRLLPGELGFVDTVRGDCAQSVWAAGRVVNQLAAVPSMHFGYAFMIAVGCGRVAWREKRVGLAVFSAVYPAVVLLVVVVTANHYWVDAVAAAGNRVFLRLRGVEAWVLGGLRVERLRGGGGRRW